MSSIDVKTWDWIEMYFKIAIVMLIESAILANNSKCVSIPSSYSNAEPNIKRMSAAAEESTIDPN